MQDTNEKLTALFIEYHDTLEKYCYRLVHYDPKYRTVAEDAVQIAFSRAVEDPEGFNTAPNPYGWLAVCSKNYIQSKLRQQKRRTEIADTRTSLDECRNVEDPTDAIIRWIDASELRGMIDSFYASLTDKEKLVFKDYYERDCSLKETAARTGLSLEAARGAVQRIRSKAKKNLLPMMIIMIGQCILNMMRTV